jgi:ATPase family protein associated with various cellular activities (AAA)
MFGDVPHTPQQHFTLYFYAALLRLAAQVSAHFGSSAEAARQLPFLTAYLGEMNRCGLEGDSFGGSYRQWIDALEEWERRSRVRLPLASLRNAADLTHDDLVVLAQIGLPDEDLRLGTAYDVLQGGAGDHRTTPAILAAAWQGEPLVDARASAHRLQALGLVEPVTADRLSQRPCAAVWDAVRGSTITSTIGWARFRPVEQLTSFDAIVMPAPLRADCERLARALASGAAAVIAIRGPRHNGRRTAAGAVARLIGKGALDVDALDGPHDPRWRTAATLACLLNAVIITAADTGPSEPFALPDADEHLTPIFVTMAPTTGLTGRLASQTITLHMPIPGSESRRLLWQRSLASETPALTHLRMTSGNIVRAATMARASATLSGAIDGAALWSAIRTLDREGLDALAQRIDPAGPWSLLATSRETREELNTLAARCRQRERLGAFVGEACSGVNPGVRALFKGPSGTGKTLAARILAGALGMDVYRVDLASVVNKYIGETEKNLDRVFARAEELDVILLLDEGDALLTQRTAVQSANDRYANLETNFLLQRLESYAGILIVTTNAGDRIDTAFERRMDVVIEFALPDAAERRAIWEMHLPDAHAIEGEVLQAAAQRCALSGGQIRNAALHAALLAVDSGAPVGSCHLEAAVAREYRKQGGLSPLRSRGGPR